MKKIILFFIFCCILLRSFAQVKVTGNLSICKNGTTTLVGTPECGTWAPAECKKDVISIDPKTGVVTGKSVGTATVTYTVKGYEPATVIVTVNEAPGEIEGNAIVCEGQTTSLSDQTMGGKWINEDNFIASIESKDTCIVTGIAPGTSTIIYVLKNGCAQPAVITVNAAPTITSPSYIICNDDTVVLNVSTTGGTWSTNRGVINTTTGIFVASLGSAMIKFTQKVGCPASATIQVVSTLPPIISDTRICIKSTPTLHNVITGGAWSSSNTTVATIGSGTGYVSGVKAGTTTISYKVKGCINPQTVNVTIDNKPSEITGDNSVIVGKTITLSDTSSGGIWSVGKNNTNVVIGSSSGTITGMATGTDSISYTLSPGCYTTATITVMPPQLEKPRCGEKKKKLVEHFVDCNRKKVTGIYKPNSHKKNKKKDHLTLKIAGQHTKKTSFAELNENGETPQYWYDSKITQKLESNRNDPVLIKDFAGKFSNDFAPLIQSYIILDYNQDGKLINKMPDNLTFKTIIYRIRLNKNTVEKDYKLISNNLGIEKDGKINSSKWDTIQLLIPIVGKTPPTSPHEVFDRMKDYLPPGLENFYNYLSNLKNMSDNMNKNAFVLDENDNSYFNVYINKKRPQGHVTIDYDSNFIFEYKYSVGADSVVRDSIVRRQNMNEVAINWYDQLIKKDDFKDIFQIETSIRNGSERNDNYNLSYVPILKKWVASWIWLDGFKTVLNPFRFTSNDKFQKDTTTFDISQNFLKIDSTLVANIKDTKKYKSYLKFYECDYDSVKEKIAAFQNFPKKADANKKSLQAFTQIETVIHKGILPVTKDRKRKIMVLRNYYNENDDLLSEKPDFVSNYPPEDRVAVLYNNILPDQKVVVSVTKNPFTDTAKITGEAIRGISAIGSISSLLTPATSAITAFANAWIENKKTNGNPSPSLYINDHDFLDSIKTGVKNSPPMPTNLAIANKDTSSNYRSQLFRISQQTDQTYNYTVKIQNLKDKSIQPIDSTRFNVGKRSVVQVFAGVVGLLLPANIISVDTSHGTLNESATRQTDLQVIAGVKFYPINGGMYLGNSKFWPGKREFWARWSLSVAVGIPQPLNNLYGGIGWDIVPGLTLNGGAHFYTNEVYDIQNGEIISMHNHFLVNGYVGFTMDPVVVFKLLTNL